MRNLFLLKFLLVVALLCPTLPTLADTTDDEQALTQYFYHHLLDMNPSLPDLSTIDWTDVSSAQEMVWRAWQQANAQLVEDGLPTLAPLTNEDYNRWILPEDLEPSAIMPFYFGYKGEASERPETGYPMYIFLHGSGDKDEEFALAYNLCRKFEDAPSVYFIPQIPNEGDYYRWWQKSKQYAWERLIRLAMLNPDIDPDRLFFVGISEGAYGSQRLASFYGDYLAGAGPMAGGEPLKNAPAENCFNLAFNLRTGANDTGFYRSTLTSYAQQAFKKLKMGWPDAFNYSITLVPDCAHKIPYGETTPWLAQQPSRNPYPKNVQWENFDMDGQKRHGYFNLWEEENPLGTKSGRVFYTQMINDNVVTLTIDKVSYTVMETRDGIDLRWNKSRKALTTGKLRVYLNPELIDPTRPVTVKANGQVYFYGLLEPSLADMATSVSGYYDKRRIYPASVLVDLAAPLTGIQHAKTNTKQLPVFDLSGRRIQPNQPGIQINANGQKKIVR